MKILPKSKVLAPKKPKVIEVSVDEVKDLDPDKVYGVLMYKPFCPRERIVMPATGMEIRRHGRQTFDWNVIKHTPESTVPSGFRLVEFLDTTLMIAVCTWTGPKYTPQEEPAPLRRSNKARVKIGKAYVKKHGPTASHRKIRVRLGRRG